MKHCASRSAWPRVERPVPPRPPSTANRSRPRKGGPRGYDAGKKVCGRKRHIVVDTTGLVLAVAVHPANVQDRDGAYSGKLEQWAKDFGGWILVTVQS